MEQPPIPYADVLLRRAAQYREEVAAMSTPPEIAEFVETMTRRFGPTVKVWQNVVEDWRIALLLAAWGEEPSQWPEFFGPSEIEYAQKWAAGRTPKSPVVVTYLN